MRVFLVQSMMSGDPKVQGEANFDCTFVLGVRWSIDAAEALGRNWVERQPPARRPHVGYSVTPFDVPGFPADAKEWQEFVQKHRDEIEKTEALSKKA